MGRWGNNYILIRAINEGNDHAAELIIERIKPMFKKAKRELTKGHTEVVMSYIEEIEALLFSKE